LSLSGIHVCPQTSHTATRVLFHPMQALYRIQPKGHNTIEVPVK
jgi:DNA invertase Pin-like site-specific DNA recombinase